MSLSTTATTALPLDTARANTKPFAIPRRPLKLFTAASLLCAGAYGILSEQQYVTSSNAIVSAYVLDIRTPIEGTVTQLPGSPGTAVSPRCSFWATWKIHVADHQHLDNLRTLEDVAQSSAAGGCRPSLPIPGRPAAMPFSFAPAPTADAVTERLTLAVARSLESNQSKPPNRPHWRQAADRAHPRAQAARPPASCPTADV